MPSEEEGQEHSPAQLSQQDNAEQVDPKIRQLEQIQQQGDAGNLLRAQMILQERQNPAPQRSEQTW
ncbi:hypothetical protein VIBNISFn27_750001 [Vibrio nigripulchritudo SFn27]|nr:hypothetical protein VIBNIBLFn1_550143 [Vibrio nigripulchritudo BLFn1]CCN90638.1 hypothetical protein VIBNISFn27_750001 [Vibrio nigripulchritudo SFn27]CCN97225.1 hypothetical protein VIBNIENn2_920001 [Vibrio nigripulchritudo ENn2]CCO39860.1 hypothetical protein VIBNISFn135_200001 [Vibrio nigripulchritudo SFn135]CCO51001.1 hypothetical protein VIBNIWn13_1070001 [Vibrio nigripulchritudo Wn13]